MAELVATIPVHGVYAVAFWPRQLRVHAVRHDATNGLAKIRAAQALQNLPQAEAILDGPMHADRGSWVVSGYTLRDPAFGTVPGGTGGGLFLNITGGQANWADALDPAATVAVELYPPLVRGGDVVARADLNTGHVWRAGVGQLADGRLVFAVGEGSMVHFATRLRAIGCVDAGYTDGGGSTELQVRGHPRVGSPEDRAVGTWLYVDRNVGGGSAVGATVGVAALAVAVAMVWWTVRR